MPDTIKGSEQATVNVDAVLERMMQATQAATQAGLAEVLGVGKAAISDAKRRRVVPAKWYQRLSWPPYRINPGWLETGQGEPRLPAAQGRGVAEGDSGLVRPFWAMPRPDGEGGLAVRDESTGPYAFDKAWLQERGDPASLRLLRVTGESMRPTLCDEDVVLVDLAQRDILEGKIYAIRIDDDVVVKRVGKKPGRLVLISDNREYYEALDVMPGDGATEVLGRVVWIAREGV